MFWISRSKVYIFCCCSFILRKASSYGAVIVLSLTTSQFLKSRTEVLLGVFVSDKAEAIWENRTDTAEAINTFEVMFIGKPFC
jgi:hypothetical protein